MTKRFLLGLLILLTPCLLRASEIIQFRVSKPYGLLNFLETMVLSHNTSQTLQQYIADHVPATDTAFWNIGLQFQQIILDYNYERSEFPENRHRTRSTKDLFIIAAVQSDNLEQFRNRTTGIIPNSGHILLMQLMKKAEPYYNRLIWDSCYRKTLQQKAALEQYIVLAGKAFLSFSQFYGSSWMPDQTFTVALYPIPGKNGHSTATPHANSLCVSVFADETAHEERMGVVLHEICHILYDEQPNALQHQLDSLFRKHPSPYAPYAYAYLDEGLATALGNGWGYYLLKNRMDTTAWYDDIYIDGMGHALFPLVASCINERKTIDSTFVNKAIDLFAQTFPQSVNDYNILFNKTHVYSNAETDADRNGLNNIVRRNFRISSMMSMTPIDDPFTLENIKTSAYTQLIIVHRNHAETFKKLTSIFPQLSGYLKGKKDKAFIVAFHDLAKRPIIIISANNNSEVSQALTRMQKNRYMNPAVPYQAIL